MLGAGPASTAPTDILTDQNRAAEKQEALDQGIEQVSKWLKDRTGRDITGPYLLLGAGPRSVQTVLDHAYKALEKPRPKVPINLRQLCGGRAVNGVASRDFILICFPGAAPVAGDDPRLNALLAHEAFHQMQYDLADVRNRPFDAQGRRRLGPAWMVEGTAEIVEYLYARDALPVDGPDLFKLQNPARRSRVRLNDLHRHGTVSDASSYGAARFAAYLLARDRGVDGFVTYFQGLGLGLSQADAFESAFGYPMAAFEATFEQVRRDYGAARDWNGAQVVAE